MDQNNLLSSFAKLRQIDETASALSQGNVRVHWKGLVGSSKSLTSICVAQQVPGNHLFILNDKEEAAYFLNDLEGLFPGDKRVLFFPASYRVPYQLEETDNANVVTRAEVLERISGGANAWIVTYPEALFEKVPTQKNLVKNTLRVEQGKNYSIDFINELLLEYEFERVDFVYEPGQFSIRGGIVDVFSYANDFPFRIEFFGEEVESIRTFDAATQLSINTHAFFNVIPNIQGQLSIQSQDDIFSFLGPQLTCWISSFERMESILRKEYDRSVEIYSGLNETVRHTLPSSLYLSSVELQRSIDNARIIEWGPVYHFKSTKSFEFDFIPQPNFNKNFELLKSDLLARQNNRFENLIFSNQPRQIERLYQIFEDIGAEVNFTAMNFALHEGFISPEMKLVCYTK